MPDGSYDAGRKNRKMKIESGKKTKTLKLINITLLGGINLPIVMDEAAGDWSETAVDCIIFHLVPKPSLTDPDIKTTEEVITVSTRSILYSTRTTREVEPLDPEQQKEMITFLRELAKESKP